MLKRFTVPLKDEVRVPEWSLRRTVTAVFEKMGVAPEDAAVGADVLVTADLRGVETHGVSNMLRSYVAQYGDGSLNPRPEWRIMRETPGTAAIDADRGLAVILGPKAMQLAVDKARKVGVGVVTMLNAGHSGPIGHHAMVAAQNDMIGVCMTAGGMAVVPTFGAEPRLGTNPIAVAAPARNEAPFLFDAATSIIAGNKLRLANRVGATLLPGWIADADGSPNTTPTPVPPPEEFNLLLMGSTRENGSHKGYGFSMMAEIMATLLSGNVSAMLGGVATGGSHFFAAYNIEAFTDLDAFKDSMDGVLSALKTTKPAPGHERVIYPGLSEFEEEQERHAKGIPLHTEVIEWFDGITSELSIPALERVWKAV